MASWALRSTQRDNSGDAAYTAEGPPPSLRRESVPALLGRLGETPVCCSCAENHAVVENVRPSLVRPRGATSRGRRVQEQPMDRDPASAISRISTGISEKP